MHQLKRGQTDFIVDNTWVVLYNPWLLLKYDSHINLEYCASIVSVNYIFKYVYKGHDCMKTDSKVSKINRTKEAYQESIGTKLQAICNFY